MIMAQHQCTETLGDDISGSTLMTPSRIIRSLSDDLDSCAFDEDMSVHTADDDDDDAANESEFKVELELDLISERANRKCSMENIEELLGSSLESLEEPKETKESKRNNCRSSSYQSPTLPVAVNHAEWLIRKLEDSPNTRRRKLLEADELVSEEEEDDIDSEPGSFYEEEFEFESTASSGDYDDITDDEEDDADSGEYYYEEIELPDCITPIQKNWRNSWFCSTHRRRMEQISEGEEESSHSEGSYSLKGEKAETRNDLDKSWGSLDSHLRSLHSQRSLSSSRFHKMSSPPPITVIEALLPAKSPVPKRDRVSRKAPQNVAKRRKQEEATNLDKNKIHRPTQKQRLVQSKEAEEEQELNDSLRTGDRTAFLKAKKKAAAKKKREKQGKKKKKGHPAKIPTLAEENENKRSEKKIPMLPLRDDEGHFVSTIVKTEKHERKKKGTNSNREVTRVEKDEAEQSEESLPNLQGENHNFSSASLTPDNGDTDGAICNDSKSKSRSKRKNTVKALDSDALTSETGSQSSIMLNVPTKVVENHETEKEHSARSKSKSKRKSKRKDTDTDKDVEKSDRSNSKSRRKLKIDVDEPNIGDVEGQKSSSRRKLKDVNEIGETSPTKSKKASKSKRNVTEGIESESCNVVSAEAENVLPVQQSTKCKNKHRDDEVTGNEASKKVEKKQNVETNDDEVAHSNQRASTSPKSRKGSTRKLQPLQSIPCTLPLEDTEASMLSEQTKQKRSKSPKFRKGTTMLTSTMVTDDNEPTNLSESPKQRILRNTSPIESSSTTQHCTNGSSSINCIPEGETLQHSESLIKTRSRSPKIRTDFPARPHSLQNLSLSKEGKADDAWRPSSEERRSKSPKSRRSSTRKAQSMKNLSTDESCDDEKASTKARSSKKSRSKSPKARKGSSKQPHSMHNLTTVMTSTIDEDEHGSLRLVSGKRGGKRPMSPMPPQSQAFSGPTDMEKSAKVKDSTIPAVTQVDSPLDSMTDMKRSVSSSNFGSRLSFSEKQHSKGKLNLFLFSRKAKVQGTDDLDRNEEECSEETEARSVSNRRAGFFQSLLSPIRRSKSFSGRSRKNFHDQNLDPSVYDRNYSPSNHVFDATDQKIVRPGSKNQKVSESKNGQSRHFESSPSANTVQMRLQDVLATSDDLRAFPSDEIHLEGEPTLVSLAPIALETGNTSTFSPSLCMKEDSTTTHKTSTMSLSLEEDNSIKVHRSIKDVEALKENRLTETTIQEEPSSKRAVISGTVKMEPNSYRVESVEWTSVLSTPTIPTPTLQDDR